LVGVAEAQWGYGYNYGYNYGYYQPSWGTLNNAEATRAYWGALNNQITIEGLRASSRPVAPLYVPRTTERYYPSRTSAAMENLVNELTAPSMRRYHGSTRYRSGW